MTFNICNKSEDLALYEGERLATCHFIDSPSIPQNDTRALILCGNLSPGCGRRGDERWAFRAGKGLSEKEKLFRDQKNKPILS